MKTYVISLKKSVERRQRMQTMLNKADIKFSFFDAVDGSKENFLHKNKAVPEKTKRRFGYNLENGEIACYASHYLIWEKCIELNEAILVLEDNGVFTEQFKDCFQLFDDLSQNYDFVKLGGTHHTNKKLVKTQLIEKINTEIDLIRYSKRNAGTVGYFISPKAAKLFIAHSNEFLEPVDNFMEKPWRHSIKSYCFHPNILLRIRSSVPSIIGSNRKNKNEMKLTHKVCKEIYKAYEKIQYKLYK